MPALPETAWLDIPPDLICEVLSPTTARVDRVTKLPLYASFGVQHAWLIDPDIRTLEAFENQAGKWLLLATFENDDKVRIAPFDAVEIEFRYL